MRQPGRNIALAAGAALLMGLVSAAAEPAPPTPPAGAVPPGDHPVPRQAGPDASPPIGPEAALMPGPGRPRGPAGPHEPPPPPAPEVRVERANGVVKVDVRCGARDDVNACAEIAARLVDKMSGGNAQDK